MKVYRFSRPHDIDSLSIQQEPTPRPQRGEVLVRIKASSLNYRDLALIDGNYSSAQNLDLIPMSDSAGEIVEVGEGVDDFKPGDRVVNTFHARWYAGRAPADLGREAYGSNRDGWLAEYKAVSQEAIVKAPQCLTFEEAATLPCAGVTAWTSLRGLHPLLPGATILTLGTGGVSCYAVQLAKRAFNARVISTTSSAAKAERLKQLGADEVIDYNAVPAWGKAVRALTGGRGVDRVVEIGGAATLAQSLKAIAPQGEIAIVGFLDTSSPSIGFDAFFRSRATLTRISVGSRADLLALVDAVDLNDIHPVVDQIFPFDRALDAWRHFKDRNFIGKVVISHA